MPANYDLVPTSVRQWLRVNYLPCFWKKALMETYGVAQGKAMHTQLCKEGGTAPKVVKRKTHTQGTLPGMDTYDKVIYHDIRR